MEGIKAITGLRYPIPFHHGKRKQSVAMSCATFLPRHHCFSSLSLSNRSVVMLVQDLEAISTIGMNFHETRTAMAYATSLPESTPMSAKFIQ
ncbi:MAG: hypothetical protein KKE53_17125 [Proteobacteria bacterium]|nr:hypothetical protein [Pseudomonadota bacterium]